MKHVRKSTVATAALIAAASLAQADPHWVAVVDTSALVTDTANAEKNKQMLVLSFLEHRERHARLSIIDTETPSVKWEGTPAKADREVEQMMAVMEGNPRGCADLVRAFEHVDLAVQLSDSDDIRILVISPLLNTDAPCGGPVRRPQATPTEILQSRFFEDDRVTAFEMFAPDRMQQTEWLSAISEAAEDSDMTIDMFSNAQALEALASLHERD